MVRKAPATDEKKGSQKDETRMPGITDNTDFLQKLGSARGQALDEAIYRVAQEKNADDVMAMPIGGLNDDISAPINNE